MEFRAAASLPGMGSGCADRRRGVAAVVHRACGTGRGRHAAVWRHCPESADAWDVWVHCGGWSAAADSDPGAGIPAVSGGVLSRVRHGALSAGAVCAAARGYGNVRAGEWAGGTAVRSAVGDGGAVAGGAVSFYGELC